MSLNIQTANGLLEIGGKVTKEKVVSALGYEPADKKVETTVDGHTKDTDIHITSDERTLWNKNVEDLDTHTSNKTVHVTSAEKETWNNKSDVKHYEDLEGAPNIAENDSGSMIVADESGNIIMQVDADGVSTTNVNTKTVKLDGKDLGERLDELEASSLPNILDNETGDLTIADESGNAIMKVDASGLETTTVTAKSAVIDGIDITTKLDEHKEAIDGVSGNLTTHTSNSTVHITADERNIWNNKSDFSGNYNDLTNAPDIKEDESGEVVYVDKDNNVIAKIGENGFETTQVIANTVIANGVDVGSSLSSHTGNTDIHVTAAERTAWNAKADTDYVDQKVADLVNSAPAALDTLDELAAALGDDANFAATVATQIGSKVDQTTFDAHTHTKAQVGLGNVDNTSDANKPVSTAQREALNELKSELSESIVSESKEWIIADNSGNIIAKVDANGLETTTVTADAVVVNGTDLQTTLDGKANAGHAHTVANITDLTATAKELNYMDGVTSNVQTQLDGKAPSSHTHSQYLVANDIVNKTDKVYVDEKIDEAKTDASNKDAVVLVETQKSINAVQTALDTHEDDNVAHITAAERTTWNAKISQTDFKTHTDNQSNPHKVTKAQVGLGNVDNTSDINKPVSTAQQTALNTLKTELSESIVSESKEWIVVDNNGNIVAKVDANGLETTNVTAKSAVINGVDVEASFAGKSDIGHIHEQYLEVSDIEGLATEEYVTSKIAEAKLAESDIDLSAYYTKTQVDEHLAEKASTSHTHDEYLAADDISDKADKSYVDEELDRKISEAKADASNKDAVVLFEVQNTLSNYYTKAEIDALELITVADIDVICGVTA